MGRQSHHFILRSARAPGRRPSGWKGTHPRREFTRKRSKRSFRLNAALLGVKHTGLSRRGQTHISGNEHFLCSRERRSSRTRSWGSMSQPPGPGAPGSAQSTNPFAPPTFQREETAAPQQAAPPQGGPVLISQPGEERPVIGREDGSPRVAPAPVEYQAVSYTHLTLPTKA